MRTAFDVFCILAGSLLIARGWWRVWRERQIARRQRCADGLCDHLGHRK